MAKPLQNFLRMSLISFVSVVAVLLNDQNHASIAQDSDLWADVSTDAVIAAGGGEQVIVPNSFRLVALNAAALEQRFAAAAVATEEPTIILPMPDGALRTYRYRVAETMAPELAKLYPEIRAFEGQGVEDPSEHVRFDWTPAGFHAMVFSADGNVMIDPYRRGDVVLHMSYYRSEHVKKAGHDQWTCTVDQGEGTITAEELKAELGELGALASSGTQLRTYRLALAATGEYSAYHQGSATTEAAKKANVLAAMVTTMNRVNGIFQTEAGIRMQIIPNNDQVIFLDAATDPYSNNNGSAMLAENQTTIDARIGAANYDIGHVFSTGGGGVASLQSPCSANKARGVTGSGSPIGDAFDVDYVAHEIGHQFGANHTFNSDTGSCNGNRADDAAYEPGSGTTIMGYAGICPPENLQPNSDPFFHSKSFDEMVSFSVNGNGNGCAVVTQTSNRPPQVEAGSSYDIPARTSFALEGSASDPDGDAVTYQWQQYDLGEKSTSAETTTADDGTRPLFRVFNPVRSPVRYFRNITSTLANTTFYGEGLPTTTRTMNFRLVARDGRSGVAYDATSVRTTDTGAAFAATTPATGTVWTAGQAGLVEWNVAGTTAAPISCTHVDLLLSNNGGFSWPFVLKRATPNDGSQSVTVIGPATSNARVKVACSGNIFFAVSRPNFTVNAGWYVSTALPSIGNPAGGASIQLLGAGLSGVTAAAWNGASVQFTVLSDTSLSLITPPGSPGAFVSVTLSSGQQTSTFEDVFRYASPPTVSSLHVGVVSPTLLNYVFTFDSAVSGVDAADFTLATVGVNGASIVGVAGAGRVYTVAVASGVRGQQGNGHTLRLDIGTNATISGPYDVMMTALPYAGRTCYVSVRNEAVCPRIVTSAANSGPGTLRQAIADAVAGETIAFNAALSSTDIMLQSALFVDKRLTIDGGLISMRATLNGGDATRLIEVTDAGSLTLNGMQLVRGRNTSQGAAILNRGALTVTNGAILSNTTTGSGGAISNPGRMVAANVTFSGNRAEGQYSDGGTIYAVAGSRTELLNVTIGDSTSTYEAVSSYGTLIVRNTVMADASNGDCWVDAAGVFSGTNNLFENSPTSLGRCGSAHSGDPGLQPLAFNGGPTLNRKVSTASAAINNGAATVCANAPVAGIDQRGRARPIGVACDIGAVEEENPGVVPTPTPIPPTPTPFSNNANLSGLVLSAGTLAPAFVSNTTNYAASVPNAVTSVIVTATKAQANAVVVVTNAAGVCAQNRCNLIVGTNRITATVTAQDGATRKAYVVVVTRAAQAAENWDDIAYARLIGALPFSETADTSAATQANDDPLLCTGYKHGSSVWYHIVPAASGVLTFTTAGSNYDTVLGVFTGSRGALTRVGCNDDVSNSVTTSRLSLTVTSGTQYYVEVVDYGPLAAANAATKAAPADAVRVQGGGTLVFGVTAAPAAASNNANLSGLVLSAGTLAPAFVSNTTNYAASVPNAVTSVIVTATKAQANAVVVVTNAAGVCAQNRCNLIVGTNRITATVTAQDGTTRKPYVVVVTRAAASNNANLSGLVLSAGTLAPAFVSNTTNYAASVPNAVTSVIVTATKAQANAVVVVTNAAGVCAQNRCNLIVGTNRITATVTAQDGTTRKPYVVVVTRAAASNNANLSGLVLSAGTLAPAFVSNTTNYAASVPNAVTSVIVTATKAQANAVVVVTNAAGVCAQNRCNLIVGTNRITATVTAQDGTTRKAYVVVVTRAAGAKGGGKNLGVSRRDEPFAAENYMGAIPAENRRKAGMRGSRM